jgi:hypothetical protein
MAAPFPSLRSVVLDTTDARRLAEFYREVLGSEYRPPASRPPPASPTRRAPSGWCSSARRVPGSRSSRSTSCQVWRILTPDDPHFAIESGQRVVPLVDELHRCQPAHERITRRGAYRGRSAPVSKVAARHTAQANRLVAG